MGFLNLLLKGITNPRALIGLLLVMLMVAVWVLGPSLLGLRGMTRILVMVLLGLILGGVQFLLARRAKRNKDQAAVDLETSLIMEADDSIARADVGEKIAREDARRELLAAIDVIKSSRLADGTSSKAALYVLPWYLVMGTAGSGKSGVIRHSGLQRPGKGPGELRGIGSSSNCEWWFTNQAVVLEADRRFTETTGAAGAVDGWRTFLETLAKQRPRTSVNGVVVTVAATELLGCAAGDVEARARLLRERLDAMMDTLKQVFPVYLVVTKLDLVHGFNDYFAGLPDNAAQQIFGATVRSRHMRSGQPEQIFAHELERLYRVLCRRRQLRLVQDDGPALRDGTYLFPLEFRALGDNLGRFVRLLFEDDVYGQSPLLRGLYFTSTGGEGAAAEAVLARVDRELGLPQEPGALPRPAAGGRALFLHDIFRRVILPDRDIARPTRRVARRIRLVRRVLQAATLGALGLLALMLIISFGRNLNLIRTTRNLASDARNVSLRGESVADLYSELGRLEGLRLQLVRLDRLDDLRPPTLGLGLYRGHRLNKHARGIYLDRFSVIVSDPSREVLESWLRRTEPTAEEYPEFESRYRVCRLLNEPEHAVTADTDLVADVLYRAWTERDAGQSPPSGAEALLRDHVAFAFEHRDDLEPFAAQRPDIRPELKRDCNGYVDLHWSAETIYRREVDRINRERQADLGFGLDRFSNAAVLLESHEGSREAGTDVVPAAFTRNGWWEEFRPFLIQSDEQLRNDWLLGEVFSGKERPVRAELLDLYVHAYREAWIGFLSSVKVKTSVTVDAASSGLFNMGQDRSVYYDVLRQAAVNLDVLAERDEQDEAAATAFRQLREDFDRLHAFWITPSEGDEPQKPVDGHRERLIAIQAALQGLLGGDSRANAAAFTKGIFADPTSRDDVIGGLIDFSSDHCLTPGRAGNRVCSDALLAFLKQPALAAWRASLRETERHLDTLWSNEVLPPYRSTVRGGFPIDPRSGRDIGLVEFGSFFGIGGTLHVFYQERLGPYLRNERGETVEVYESELALRPDARNLLAKAYNIRQALFRGGGLEPGLSFTLQPKQMRSVGATAAVADQSTFQLGSGKLVYEDGTGRRMPFDWPESLDRLEAQLAVRTRNGGNYVAKGGQGDWSLLRLIYQATDKPVPNTNNQYDLEWTLGDGNAGVQILLPYRLVVDNVHHAMEDEWFALTVPEHLHR